MVKQQAKKEETNAEIEKRIDNKYKTANNLKKSEFKQVLTYAELKDEEKPEYDMHVDVFLKPLRKYVEGLEKDAEEVNEPIRVYSAKQGKKAGKDGQYTLNAFCCDCSEGHLKLHMHKTEEGTIVIDKVSADQQHTDICSFKSENDILTVSNRINEYMDIFEADVKAKFDFTLLDGINLLNTNNVKANELINKKIKEKKIENAVLPTSTILNNRRAYLKRKEKDAKGLTNISIAEAPDKIKKLFGDYEFQISDPNKFRTSAVCIDSEFRGPKDFFIQITTYNHLYAFHRERVQAYLHKDDRNSCKAVDGTFNLTQSNNQVGIVVSSMDCNHDYYMNSMSFCYGETGQAVYRSFANLERESIRLFGEYPDPACNKMTIKKDGSEAISNGLDQYADEYKITLDKQEFFRHFKEAVKKWFSNRKNKKLCDYNVDFLKNLELHLEGLANSTSMPEFTQLFNATNTWMASIFDEDTEEYKYLNDKIDPENKPSWSLCFIQVGIGYMNNGAEGLNRAYKKNVSEYSKKPLFEALEDCKRHFELCAQNIQSMLQVDQRLPEEDKRFFPIQYKLSGTDHLNSIWQRVKKEMPNRDYWQWRTKLSEDDDEEVEYIIYGLDKNDASRTKHGYEQFVDKDGDVVVKDWCTQKEDYERRDIVSKWEQIKIYNTTTNLCNCVYFYKYGFCKHSLYYMLQNELVADHSDLIDAKKKRKYPQGRKRKMETLGWRYGEVIGVKRKTVKPRKQVQTKGQVRKVKK